MFKRFSNKYEYSFRVSESGLYSINFLVICKKRNKLKVIIDQITTDCVVVCDGNKTKGITQIINLVLFLEKGGHVLKFFADKEAEVVSEPKSILLDFNNGGLATILQDIQSEEKDRQPWISVVLLNLPLSILDVAVSCQKRFLDSDDVKLIVDNQIQKNNQTSWWNKNWFWQGSKMRGNTEENRFYFNFPSGVHFVELWADRTPILKNISIFINNKVDIKRVPTMDDPEWTGNFFDDPEAIILARLIFGEANGQSSEAKASVGWSVVNRMQAKSWWPNNIQGVILQVGQYDPFKDNDSNFLKIVNPLGYKNVSELDKRSWFESYEIASGIISGKIPDPTEATHFNSFSDERDREWFEKKVIPKGKFLRKIGDIYFYWSPN